METYLDGMWYNIYGTGNQYPEVGYWILRGILNFESWYPSWDTDRAFMAADTDRTFMAAAPKLYNVLPLNLRSISDFNIFKQDLKIYLFREAFY